MNVVACPLGLRCLALADAFDLQGVEGIELPAALALLLRADLSGPPERKGECLLEDWADLRSLRRMSRMIRPSRLPRMRNCR